MTRCAIIAALIAAMLVLAACELLWRARCAVRDWSNLLRRRR